MEKQNILIAQIVVTILSILLGALLHFTYKWSKKNKIVGLFSATNESTWEHLKLSFFPILLLGIFECIFLKEYINNCVEAIMIGSILSIILITVIFYTYKTIFKRDNFILDILTFTVSVIISEIVIYKIFLTEDFSTIQTKALSIIAIVLISLSFAVFTYLPPKLELFKDPTKQIN